jgi:hypothetical protein
MRHAVRIALPALAALAAACVNARPAPPVQRAPTPVAASFGRTWDAAIDAFAARNIPIRAIDRASGFIVADATATPEDTAYADCGMYMGFPVDPTGAVYNVVVRGDSTRSSVRVTVRWEAATGVGASTTDKECSTKGRWEAEVEAQIKARAEAA